MSDSKWWLVSYDVHNAKRLRKCAKKMEGHGERVQYSVFRCWLSKTEMEKLRWELTELLDKEDSVLLIPLCGGCVDGMLALRSQEKPDWPGEPPKHVIL